MTARFWIALGVAAHEGSTVLVVLNSLRLLLGNAAKPITAAAAA